MKRLNLLEETSNTLLNEIIVILLVVTYLQINEVINTLLDEGEGRFNLLEEITDTLFDRTQSIWNRSTFRYARNFLAF